MLIFLIDDSRSMLTAMQQALASVQNCTLAPFLEPQAALKAMQETPPDLVLVDYDMPGINGIQVIEQIRSEPKSATTPVVMITANSDGGVKMRAMEAGATEFLSKPFDHAELSIRVRNLLAIRAEQLALAKRAKSLQRKFEEAMAKVERREEEIIWRLARAMGCRDGDTGSHLDRVAIISRLIAEELGFDRKQARVIFLATPLHDVGKLAVRDAILMKPGKLTPEEFAEMQMHTAFGSEILKDSASELIQTAQRIAASHHERWDGTGYPNRLKGTDIPIEARIVAVADVFDALCSQRPYKAAWPKERALQEIIDCSGKHFDPACVAAFRRRWAEISTLFDHPDQTDDQAEPESKLAMTA